MLNGFDDCQSWWVASRHLSAVSAAEHCDPCLSPRPGELSYRKIPNNSWGVYLFQSLNRPGVYLGQAFNSLLTKIQDENVTNFSSFSVNSPASCWAIVVFCRWSCCSGGNNSANQHSLQTPHLCCHSQWWTFVSPWSFCGTVSRGMPICW